MLSVIVKNSNCDLHPVVIFVQAKREGIAVSFIQLQSENMIDN